MKLVHRFLRNIRNRRADRFIRYVDTIHLDAGPRTGPAVDADGAISESLGRVNTATVADEHARRDRCQVEEIAAEKRQLFDLLFADDVVQRLAARIHSDRLRRDLNNLACFADLQSYVSIDHRA